MQSTISNQITGLFLRDSQVPHNFEKISNKLLEQLESLVEETYISPDFMFQSLFIFKANIDYSANDFKICYSTEVNFQDEDKEVIINWILSGNLVESLFFGRFYKLVLVNFILLFEIHYTEDGSQIYIGYILKNNIDTRLYLADLYQQSLFKKLL